MKEEIIVHNIENIWQDPQCFCISEFIRDEFFYYFKCWNYNKAIANDIEEEDFLGCFNVENMISIRHLRHTKLELYPSNIDHNYKCYYYEIKNSQWVMKIMKERENYDSNWRKYDDRIYKHFIFENAEYWVEVIGTKVIFDKVQKVDEKIYLWENYG